jgi:adenine deaminase
MKISGTIIDILGQSQFPGEVRVENGKIAEIRRLETAPRQYILPGFIDAHVHVESSMLPPAEFARLAVVHGTVATVSDPHEIGNVLGVDGVRWMIENGNSVPFKFFFGAPSCVPATVFETAGAEISAAEVEELLARPDVLYLSEMMNFPGVLNGDAAVHAKLAAAKHAGKVIDGHAPGLRGAEAARYASFGISSDHECFTAEEALDKLGAGMNIIIREGSAAKNFQALIPLLRDYPERIMFCSDDKHPNDLVAGHINRLVLRALAEGIPLYNVLRAACINPILHYRLPVGRLAAGDAADFIVVEDVENFRVLQTYINGELVAENGASRIRHRQSAVVNNFRCDPVKPEQLRIPAAGKKLRVIQALDGQLITTTRIADAVIENGAVQSTIHDDILKLVVINRYQPAPPALAFVGNFGLRRGALASSVAHDSHNIIAVGADDEDLAAAVNLVVESRGGISLACGNVREVLPLPIAGLMSPDDGYQVAEHYQRLDRLAKELGCTLPSPFMTLSFLALLVIPELKLSDRGLFDGQRFEFVSLFSE